VARRITILGSTGSIGDSTTDLLRTSRRGSWQVVALTAHSRAEKLADQAIEFKAEFVALADRSGRDVLKARLQGHDVEWGVGRAAIIEAARRKADFTLSAITGAAGLEPTLAAIDQGQYLALANKECLVCAGDLFTDRVQASGATLLPIDSEHNAIFQVMKAEKPAGIRRLILTASGGPFREADMETLRRVSRAEALDHPVWDMGAKISIDSATLMNKGLELIEASYLFARPASDIDVVVHPQSIVHSMVEYIDGSVLAQMGMPDMRTPIAYAMGWPERMAAPVERLDLTQMSGLTFFEPDTERFPALRLAREALETGGRAPNILNAANEIAVAAFLEDKIGFLDIAATVETVLARHAKASDFTQPSTTIDDVILTDAKARATATAVIKGL